MATKTPIIPVSSSSIKKKNSFTREPMERHELTRGGVALGGPGREALEVPDRPERFHQSISQVRRTDELVERGQSQLYRFDLAQGRAQPCAQLASADGRRGPVH